VKRVLAVFLLLLAVLVSVLVIRAATLSSKQVTASAPPALSIDRDAAMARFVRAVQFRTISFGDATPSLPPEHDQFIAWLATAYPRVHSSLSRELVGKSLLFVWRGSDPALKPVLLMGHYDVVPIEPGTEARWEHPPFSGTIAGGYVWGRGTMDDKLTVIGLMESAESLLAEGFKPRRTIYFSFGEDEEARGAGAGHVARLLASRGVKFDAVVDEGGAITLDTIRGAPKPVAVVGIAEKGFASVELSAEGKGGHSSMPPPLTEVGALAAAVDAVQSHPFRAGVRGAAAQTFRWLAPEMPFGQRLVLANLWLFEPALQAQAKKSHSMNAMLRTTTAPTIISGGVKDNVIPSHARAVINFRLLPGDSVASVVDHVRTAVADPHVRIRLTGAGSEASPVSDPDSPQFRALQQTIGQVFPDVIVVPYLVVGATDARYFAPLSANVYRFVPARIREADLSRAHGTNERIAVGDFFDAIRFYRALTTNLAR
jgi:carboxypeptidase PM20D1